MTSDVMTLREVAAFLKVHPNTIYRMARSGKLPAFKMGTDWRFRREAIESWVRARDREDADAEGEVLHLVSWMLSQGISLTARPDEIAEILDWPPLRVKRELRALTARGYLRWSDGRVALTTDGMQEAERRFPRARHGPSGHESMAKFAERYVHR